MDVLIVEDEALMRNAFARSLQRAGYMVKEVEHGLAALAALQETPFRAIVLDLRLPFLEGKALYQNLMADYPDMAARVIFVTGFAGDPETKKFLEKTGRPFLSKPVEIEAFVAAVRHIISTGRASRPVKPESPPPR